MCLLSAVNLGFALSFGVLFPELTRQDKTRQENEQVSK